MAKGVSGVHNLMRFTAILKFKQDLDLEDLCDS